MIFIIVFLNAGILIYLGYLRSSLKNELETSSSVSLNQDAEKKAQDLTELERQVRDGYSFIERAKKINSEEERRIWWSRVLQELANASGPGIKITKFEVDKKDFRQIKVSGVAATRESMIFLEQRLKVSEFYKEVISPVSNLTSKENVSFEFTLKLKDEWKN